MKRIAPLLIIVVMLTGGWFTGQRLARPDRALAPLREVRGMPGNSTRASSEKRTPASSRNFAAEWDAALAAEEWNGRKGPGVLYELMVEWMKNNPNEALAGVHRLAQIEASKRIA